MMRCKRLILLFVTAFLFASVAQATITGQADITTLSNWRTAAALEADNEYGTDGFMVWALNVGNDVWWGGPFDISPANAENEGTFPFYIGAYTMMGGYPSANVALWSGSTAGNFGFIEDPGNGNALTQAPILYLFTDPPGPLTMTFTRANRPDAAGPFRMTVMTSEGDGENNTATVTLDDGIDPNTIILPVNGPDNQNYAVFDVDSTSNDFTLTINKTGQRYITAVAFDNGPEPQGPEFVSHPEDAVVGEGGTAEFSVEATDPLAGTLTYQWVFDPNTLGTGDEVDLDDADPDISGATTDTLTIANIEAADGGAYYCNVTNAALTSPSNSADLFVGVCLYHWPMEGDGVEANGSGHDGTLQGDASFVSVAGSGDAESAAVGDGSLELDGNGDFLKVAGDVPMVSPQGFTVTFWARPTDLTRTMQGMVGKYGTDDGTGADDNFGVSTAPAGYGGLDGINLQHDSTWTFAGDQDDPPFVENEWRFVAFVYSALDDFDAYINGENIMDFEGHGTGYTDLPGEIRIGAKLANRIANVGDVQNDFLGRIDDVKIYNYAQNAYEIAEAYTTVSETTICVENPAGDIDGDCDFDIDDLRLLAEQFLDNTLYSPMP